MSLLLWAVGQLLGVALCIAFVLALRVVLDALALFHAAGLARVRTHTRRTTA